MCTTGINRNYQDKLNDLKNKQKFTIPIKIYNNPKYCKERRSIILLIASILENHINFKNISKDKQDNIIITIEKSCYNTTIDKSNELLIYINWDNSKFTYLYQLFCNKITKNLDSESEVNNSYLINAIINDEIDLKNIANLPSDKLCPEKSDIIKQNLTMRKSQKLNYKTSSLYTCRNCGKKSVTIREYISRSLDEATSLSLTCVFCGYGWVG